MVGVNRLLSEQFFVHVSNVGNVDRFEMLYVSFLPLFGHSLQGYLAGRLSREVPKAFIVGWVHQAWEEVSSRRTCQALQRLRVDLGGGRKSKASYLKLVLQRAQVSRERAGVQTLSFRWLYVETFRGHMVKIGILSLYTYTTCSQDY